MRVLVFGGRHEIRDRLVWWSLNVLMRDGRLGPKLELVGIQGCARGWDTFSRQWFIQNGCSVVRETLLDFPVRAADWSRYGNGAGPRRNQQMLDEGRPDLGIAGPGGTGTADMKRRLESAGIPIVDLISEQWFLEGESRYHGLYGKSTQVSVR